MLTHAHGNESPLEMLERNPYIFTLSKKLTLCWTRTLTLLTLLTPKS